MTSSLMLFVCGAVLAGVLGSLFITISVSVDSWETVTYVLTSLAKYSDINASSEYFCTLASSDGDFSILQRRTYVGLSNGSQTTQVDKFFLFDTYYGPWKKCDMLSDDARQRIKTLTKTSVNRCYTFMTEYDEEYSLLPDMMKSVGRMQNSAAACFIVSVTALVAAAAVGTFAIIQKQVSAFMVTGVLYCMAGLFSIFGLTIFQTKMYYEKYQCYSFENDINVFIQLPDVACAARTVSIGWAIPFSWVGVAICLVASGLWFFITRAFRVIKS
ncbi:uncharacterized protein LOC127868896 [Dreissena polymorpha]|uniref:Uncharacterized protein n=1 Tax=Dreissena polymorpha TaxID=45954 RepID=A0A9D4RL86_DREPO|nr:uncharacterized protein LOC127868896 [Dreissena polymorpha]KAH3872956.1 hypothetical protein DPMN_036179 [Dreissena polymorpha]